MTSSVPGDSMSSLHPDDIFLVNRALDADGNYETYKVQYSEVSKAVTGPTGPLGATGATGPQGLQGEAGTSVKVLGTFNDYQDLLDFATLNGPGGTNTIEEGDIYVVYDDWSDVNWPGRDFCKAGQSVEADNCQINVAYVWALKADGTNDMFVRLGPLTGEKGPTGPYFDEVIGEADDQTAAGGQYDYKITFKDNNDYSGDPSGFTGLDDQELLIEDIQGATGSTGPYYDEIYTSVDSIEGSGDTFKRDYRITFKSSNASDPEGILQAFETLNLVGATGPGVGEMGPEGPMGLYYDKIDFTEDAFNVVDYPGDTPYGAVTVTYSGDPNGPNASLTPYTSPNVRGPRGPRGEINNLDELENLLINLYPPGTPEGDDAPWVHKGKNCGEDFYDEDVFGQKTFCHTIGFDPCNERQYPIMHWKVGSGRDFKMFFKKNVRGSVTLDGFALQRESTGSPGLVIGFEEKSGSPQIGIKTATPQTALDVKGVVAANQLVARPSNKAGQPYENSDHMAYTGFGLDVGLEKCRIRRAPSYSGACRFVIEDPVRFEYYGKKGGFKIQQSKLFVNSGGFLRLDGDQVKYSTTSKFTIPSVGDTNTTVATEFDGTRALEVVKALKPRIVTTPDGNVIVTPVKEDIEAGVMSDLKRASEGETSVETVVSMLLLSIQKLEERISALESA